MEEKRELVFVPAPAMGHLISAVELAKRLIHQHPHRISITILLLNPFLPDPRIHTYISSLIPSSLNLMHIPPIDPPIPFHGTTTAIETFVSLYIDRYKPHIKTALTHLVNSPSRSRLAGLVIDLFFTTLIDVAADLGLPTYLFFTSNAALLRLMMTLDLPNPEADSTAIAIPGFSNTVPLSVMPSPLLNKRDEAYKWFVHHGSRFRETKGILVNTLVDLERQVLGTCSGGGPAVYAVGPAIDAEGKAGIQTLNRPIMEWLDGQPARSVVLLCFGSGGGFSDPVQVGETAAGLERSGCRFLWVLRRQELLPGGFEGRVEGRGVVCGWVDQVRVLGHGAIGGFVSHCGWNSILESLWFGVPIATWPMYAEQQLNAFYLVKEKGLAVEIRLDYRVGGGGLVTAEEVERGVKGVMKESEVRKRWEEMSKKCREAVGDGGSSLTDLGQFVENLFN